MFPPPESLLLKRSPNPPPFFEHQMIAAPSADPIEKQTAKRKRTAGKKDRHSKICTAHGIRDRRMRLSLQVARKFFDIQDMLGYDKASATIEWLLGKSKQAIRELVAAKRQTNNGRFTERNELLGQVLAKKKSREKARARARWRTREKMMLKPLESLGWPNCVSTLQTHHKLGFSIDQDLLLSQDWDAGTIEKLLGNSSLSSNVSPISDNNNDDYQCCIHPNNNFMGLIRDWEMLSSVTNQQVSSMAPGNSNH